jgi:hypothetical protein
MNTKTSLLLLIGFVFNSQPGTAADRYLYTDLVGRLTDLKWLSTLPDSEEYCRQWSSFDRASWYDQATGSYLNWDANGDNNGVIREENGKFVFGQMQGPGCIWRIWSATAGKGHVKIYLDGAAEPAIDLPFEDYFNGTTKPFTRPALVHTVTNGKNCYIPIPFQKSCKIIADKDYGQYYHFTYSLFPKGTVVGTFSMNLTSEENAALDKANERLTQCGPDFSGRQADQKTETFDISLAAGQTKTITIDGKRAIVSLKVRPQLPQDVEGQRKALRELAMKVSWDDQKNPAVWCPLGDFFGTGPGVNPYRSLTLGMTDKEFYSNWYMPFEKTARIELLNEGGQAKQLSLEITHAPHNMPDSSYGRFHAKWHRDAFLPTEPQRQIDWTLLKIQGQGRYCGVQLQVWNPRGGWWGEGDEKFFIDGEKFPSTFGTGSEDYFGYAWSDPGLFQNAYHNQTISEGNKGHISVNRWHIADNVPFHTSFEGTIEKYYKNDRPTQYACVAYWYQSPDEGVLYPPVSLQERLDYYALPTYPIDVAGILVLEKPQGNLEAQGMGSYKADKWRDDEQLWYTGQPGQQVKIGIDIKSEGKYKILTRLTKAVDYGIIQFALDGRKVLEPMDLYYPDGVIATKQVELGTFELDAGRHVLSVEMVGANPNAIKRYMFGIDYVDTVKN